MTKEEVIVHNETIKRFGQVNYFQIGIPRDAQRIIGVETGAFIWASDSVISPFFFIGDPVEPLFRINKVETIGRLTLQASDSTGIFFQDEVRQKNLFSRFADFTQYTDVFNQWSHDRKKYESPINITTCSPVIEAQFIDSWGAFAGNDIYYQLNIYIWIEKKI